MYDSSVLDDIAEVRMEDEVFLDLDVNDILPGYLVSNKYRVFNKGIYNSRAKGLCPVISSGPHKGMVRARSAKGYSIAINPKNYWFKISGQSGDQYLDTHKRASDEKFKKMVHRNIMYPRYYISNYGRVWDDEQHRFLARITKKPDIPYAYLKIDNTRKAIQVAALVLGAFYFYDPSRTIGYRDDNHQNLKFSNLYQPEPGTVYLKEANDNADTVIVCLETQDIFYSPMELAKHFNVSTSRVYAVLADNKHETLDGLHIYRMKKSDAFPEKTA